MKAHGLDKSEEAPIILEMFNKTKAGNVNTYNKSRNVNVLLFVNTN